jgi:hypothetical protein
MPQLGIQYGGVKRYGASRSSVVGIGGLEPKPSRCKTTDTEATAETLTQGSKKRMQDTEVVGVGAQGVTHLKLTLSLRRQHGARVDATSTGPQYPAAGSEHRAQRVFGNGRNLADKIQLIVVQPLPEASIQLREHLHRVGSEKAALLACGHVQ